MRRLRTWLMLTAAAASLAVTGVLASVGPASASTYGQLCNPIETTHYECADDPSNAGLSGDQLLMYNSSDNFGGQQWTTVTSPYSSGYVEIVLQNHAHGTMCVDDRGGSTGTNVAIKTCNGSASQAWAAYCEFDTDGAAYPIVSDARFYDLTWNGGGEGTHLVLASYTKTPPHSQIFFGPPGMPLYDDSAPAGDCPAA